MECVLSPDSALLLDKLLRFPRAGVILFDSTAGLVVQMVTPDLSQLKSVRLEPSFFEHLRPLNLVVSMPFQKFYIPGMKSLRMRQTADATVLEYALEGCRYTKVVDSVDGDVLDPEFEAACTAQVDLLPVREVLRNARARCVRIALGRSVRVLYEGTEVELDGAVDATSPVEFKIETEPFRNILYYAELFTDYALAFSADTSCLNIIFRGPDAVVSAYIALQDCP